MSTELVFLGTSDKNVRQFYDFGSGIDLTNVSRILTSFAGSAVVADTLVDSTLYEYGTETAECDLGIITFNFNGLAIAAGTYVGTTLIFDTDHPLGQTISHGSMNSISWTFV